MPRVTSHHPATSKSGSNPLRASGWIFLRAAYNSRWAFEFVGSTVKLFDVDESYSAPTCSGNPLCIRNLVFRRLWPSRRHLGHERRLQVDFTRASPSRLQPGRHDTMSWSRSSAASELFARQNHRATSASARLGAPKLSISALAVRHRGMRSAILGINSRALSGLG